MQPQDFVATYLTTAELVKAGTGLDEDTLLAQWALETAWGSVFAGANNLGNIRCSPTSFCSYTSLGVFAQAAIQVFHNGLYAGVLATAGQSIEVQIAALGASPWDAGHYGNPPGSALIPFAKEIDMFNDTDRATIAHMFNATFYSVAQPGGDPWTQIAKDQKAAEEKAIAAAVAAGPPPNQTAVLNAIANVKTELDAVAAMLAKIEAALKSA
jgi:hypothetical protein